MPLVYLPYRSEPSAATTVLVRSTDAPALVLRRLQADVREINPDLPLW